MAYEPPPTGWAKPTFGSAYSGGTSEVASALATTPGRCPRCTRWIRWALYRPQVDRFLVVCDEEGPVVPDQVIAEWSDGAWLLNPSGWQLLGEAPEPSDAAVAVTTTGMAPWW